MSSTLREMKKAMGAPPLIRQILVPVDLSLHSEITALYAAGLAGSFKAAMTLAHIHRPEPISEINIEHVGDRFAQERSKAARKLEELLVTIRAVYPNCRQEFWTGTVAKDIALLAARLDADLIVTASHNRTTLGQLFNLAQAPKISHRAPCPVLVYQQALENPRFDIRHILAPTDLSERSREALNYAIGLAQHLQSKLTILHAYGDADSDPNSVSQAQLAVGRLSSVWEDIRSRDIVCDTIFQWGQPNRLILAAAEEFKADLIVLATNDYHWPQHLFLGSDAESILRQAPCPVLLFHQKKCPTIS
jgi:universal stress protein A